MPEYAAMQDAARAYGKANDIRGRAGGWLYQGDRPLRLQGWQELAYVLIRKNIIEPIDDQGENVRRVTRRNVVIVRTTSSWSRDAAQFRIDPAYLCAHPQEARGRVWGGSAGLDYDTCSACKGQRPVHDDEDGCGICDALLAGTGQGHEWEPGRAS